MRLMQEGRMSEITAPCDACKRWFALNELDGKPAAAAIARYGSISACADRGVQFTRMECRDCYGPEYLAEDRPDAG